MTLSLDTNLLIDVLRDRDPAARHAFRTILAQDQPVVASILVQHELLYGAARHRDPVSETRDVGRLLGQIAIEPLDRRDVAVAAEVRADLRKRGATIGPYDLLIASQASARGWTVVTENVREFGRVSGLQVVNWRSFTA